MRDRLVTNTKGQELGQKVTKRWKLESSCPYRGHTPMLPSIIHPHPSGRRGWNNNVDVPGPKQCSIHIANGNSLTSPTEKAMAPHSSTLAWKIPWTEEPGRLQSMGSRRVRHDWATSLSLFTFMHWRRKWQPILVFLPGESQGWGHTELDTTEVT